MALNMFNREIWRYYQESRDSLEIVTTNNLLPSNPPYDNLNVVEAPLIMSLQPTQATLYQMPHIPGPGRPVQIGLFRKRSHNARVLQGESSQTRPTQDFIIKVYNEPPDLDSDFSSLRWTSTIDYIIREGSYNNRTTPLWTQVAEILCPSSQFVKVKKIVVMISNITHNGQGDLLVTLKDPSGKIDGTMHHNIFRNDEYGFAIVVGAVVILRNVTICRLTLQSKCLNITARTIVKIIGVTAMVAEYEPNMRTTIEEEDESNIGYKFVTVPDSDIDE